MKRKVILPMVLTAVLSSLTGVALTHAWHSRAAASPTLTEEDIQIFAEEMGEMGAFSVGGGERFNIPLALMHLQHIDSLIIDAEHQEPNPVDFRARLAIEQKTLAEIDKEVEKITSPRILYAMAIVLYEGYEDEFRETLSDRLLFMTREAIVYRLSRLGTAKAYDYFRRLHKHYGTDAGESLKYKEMNKNFPLSIRLSHDD